MIEKIVKQTNGPTDQAIEGYLQIYLEQFHQLLVISSLEGRLSSCAGGLREVSEVVDAILEGVIFTQQVGTIFGCKIPWNGICLHPPAVKILNDFFSGTDARPRKTRVPNCLCDELVNVMTAGAP